MITATAKNPGSATLPEPSAAGPAVPLATLSRGQRAVIRETRMPTDDAALLRAMGLCDCALLTVARTGEPFIVTVSGVDGADCKCHKVGGCRIGLARAMAERIFVSVLN
jgi:Fe2+ transport system protein FeoA